MKQAIYGLLVAFVSSAQLFEPFETPKLKQTYTRPDYDYIGNNVTCDTAAYCAFQQTLYTATMTNDLSLAPRYTVNTQLLVIGEQGITFPLTCSNCATIIAGGQWSPAPTPTVSLQFYQNGIMRMNVDAGQTEPFTRFQVSDTGLPVDEDNLVLQTIGPDGNYQYTTSTEGVLLNQAGTPTAGQDDFEFVIQYSPFRIQVKSNEQVIAIVNHQDTLFFESGSTLYDQSISMGFFVNALHMFGIPERANTFLLNTTESQGPYRLWNQDMFDHPWLSTFPMYGSVPYLLGHSESQDAAVAWMNSAETWVDIFTSVNQKDFGSGLYASFTSQGGAMEFFVYGSIQGPKAVQTALSEITGYAPIPSYNSLGFHFCKWEWNSAQMLIDRSDNFTATGFPVDVLWSDIEYAQDLEYFVFNEKTFPQVTINKLNQVIQKAGRRLVIITDPHISEDKTGYAVYDNGQALNAASAVAPNVTNVWVLQPNGVDNFVGQCWPGPSVWVDYINENAQNYWSSLYLTQNFNGQTYLWGAWNDMNEPSVFIDSSTHELEQRGMPVHNIHVAVDGQQYLHMYIHNAYGGLQQRATYKGLLARDHGQTRPFTLTRSFFFGQQRWGAMWTGDSQTNYDNVLLSVNQLLTLGVSGVVFGGCDLPGFYGIPSDDLFIQFYQLGVFYPFMRAHNNMPPTDADNFNNFGDREPWLQSERVQNVIRDSIYQRYAFMHYLYTAFFESNQFGYPIIRPLWYEFPTDTNTFGISTQFMWGDSILVAPKLGAPAALSIAMNGIYNLSVYLPPSVDWYYYYNKAVIGTKSSSAQIIIIGDDQFGTFVKAGSILPILNYEQGRMSILEAINDDIRVEVYPLVSSTLLSQTASGNLYLDDGKSNAYLCEGVAESTWVQFNWTGISLSVTKMSTGYFAPASAKMINEIVIMNVKQQPTAVYNRWVNNTPSPDQGDVLCDYVYLPSTFELHIVDLAIPIDDGLLFGVEQDLIQVDFYS